MKSRSSIPSNKIGHSTNEFYERMSTKSLNSSIAITFTMKTTIEIAGYPEIVLERAVELGIARSKTDAIRLGVLALNQVYHLLDNAEDEMVVRKMQRMEAENEAAGRKLETLEDVLKKYPHLKNVK